MGEEQEAAIFFPTGKAECLAWEKGLRKARTKPVQMLRLIIKSVAQQCMTGMPQRREPMQDRAFEALGLRRGGRSMIRIAPRPSPRSITPLIRSHPRTTRTPGSGR